MMKNSLLILFFQFFLLTSMAQEKIDTLLLTEVSFGDGEITIVFKNKNNEEVNIYSSSEGIPILNGKNFAEVNLLEPENNGGWISWNSPNNEMIDSYTNRWFIAKYLQDEYSLTLKNLTVYCEDCVEKICLYNGWQVTNDFYLINLEGEGLGLELLSENSIVKFSDFENLENQQQIKIYYSNNEKMEVLCLELLDGSFPMDVFDESLLSSSIIATFKGIKIIGSLNCMIFHDEAGEEWVFYSNRDNTSGFDFRNEKTNSGLIGKKFQLNLMNDLEDYPEDWVEVLTNRIVDVSVIE